MKFTKGWVQEMHIIRFHEINKKSLLLFGNDFIIWLGQGGMCFFAIRIKLKQTNSNFRGPAYRLPDRQDSMQSR